MKQMLKKIFDYQRFSPNKRLNAIVSDVESRYRELDDEKLFMVAAAGNIEMTSELLEKKDGKPKNFL